MLQRGVGTSSSVQLCDERKQRPIQRALLDLVLLRVEVFLRALAYRDVLELLEAGVDPIGRREGSREHEARFERGRAAPHEVLVQDVRRVDEAVRPVVVPPVEQLPHELEQFPARVLPREVRVALREADLAECLHHRRPRECLREEDHLRMLAAHLVDQPFPERDRLRVGVVDAEHGDPMGNPEHHCVVQRRPEPTPILGLEVDVVDVLVFFRWVLGVLQRAVGPPVEPLGMLLQPRVVGRALDREVERDLDVQLFRRCNEALELLERAELRVDCVVSALFRADRPRATRVLRPSFESVVAAFAIRASDGVNRREIDDVEAVLRKRRQQGAHTFEASPRAREELVPRSEARERPVNVDLERLRPRLPEPVRRD